MAIATTNITLSTDITNCLQDYLGQCILLTTAQPVLGCGSVYARIWQAGNGVIRYADQPAADIRLITEL
jgi:hypothetical protein